MKSSPKLNLATAVEACIESAQAAMQKSEKSVRAAIALNNGAAQ